MIRTQTYLSVVAFCSMLSISPAHAQIDPCEWGLLVAHAVLEQLQTNGPNGTEVFDRAISPARPFLTLLRLQTSQTTHGRSVDVFWSEADFHAEMAIHQLRLGHTWTAPLDISLNTFYVAQDIVYDAEIVAGYEPDPAVVVPLIVAVMLETQPAVSLIPRVWLQQQQPAPSPAGAAPSNTGATLVATPPSPERRSSLREDGREYPPARISARRWLRRALAWLCPFRTVSIRD